MSHIITPLHAIASLFVFPHANFVIFSLCRSCDIWFAPLEIVARHIGVERNTTPLFAYLYLFCS